MLMNNVKRLGQGVMRWFWAVVLLGASCGWAAGQESGGQQDQNQNQKQEQGQKQTDKSVRPTQADPAQTDSTQGQSPQAKEETKITPRQAEELFHSVDEILAFDSTQTGLPVKKW